MDQPLPSSSSLSIPPAPPMPHPPPVRLIQRIVYLTRGELYQGRDNKPTPAEFRKQLIDRARSHKNAANLTNWVTMLERKRFNRFQLVVLNARSFSVIVSWRDKPFRRANEYQTPAELFRGLKTFVATVLNYPVQIADPSTFIAPPRMTFTVGKITPSTRDVGVSVVAGTGDPMQ